MTKSLAAPGRASSDASINNSGRAYWAGPGSAGDSNRARHARESDITQAPPAGNGTPVVIARAGHEAQAQEEEVRVVEDALRKGTTGLRRQSRAFWPPRDNQDCPVPKKSVGGCPDSARGMPAGLTFPRD